MVLQIFFVIREGCSSVTQMISSSIPNLFSEYTPLKSLPLILLRFWVPPCAPLMCLWPLGAWLCRAPLEGAEEPGHCQWNLWVLSVVECGLHESDLFVHGLSMDTDHG